MHATLAPPPAPPAIRPASTRLHAVLPTGWTRQGHDVLPIIRSWDDLARAVVTAEALSQHHTIAARLPAEQTAYLAQVASPRAVAFAAAIRAELTRRQSSDPDAWFLTRNDYPYSAWLQRTPDVSQWVFWSHRQPTAAVAARVAAAFPGLAVAAYRPAMALTVPVWHAHVFVRGLPVGERCVEITRPHDTSGEVA